MNRAEKIIDIYNKFGSKDYIGEKMTQTEHALQCAYYAKNNNYDKDIIISALLHDIGHLLFFDKNNVDLMDMYGVAKHENIGAEYLKKIGFNDRICNLIKNHVNAKRYLCSVDNTYYNKLSDASKTTMKYQGGFMSEKEIRDFQNDIYFEDSIKIRQLDDIGKQIDNVDYGKIEDYYELLNY
jgi:putative nucleotidyltransferase with HDIG domain